MFELDVSNLESDVTSSTLERRREDTHRKFETFKAEGWSTFFELVEPSGRPYLDEVLQVAEGIKQNRDLTHFLNLGIGGSSLGGEALMRALTHPYQNEGPLGEGFSRYYFPDNVDPDTNAGLLDILPAEKTLVHIASKSGSTAETAAQMLFFHEWLTRELGAERVADHLVVSTDPKSGDLRGLVDSRGYRSITIPPGVGGRFSVFGSIGVLPLALFGLDVEKFMAGAQSVAARCRGSEDNPALDLALKLHAQHVDAGRNVLVFMSYSDALAQIGDWFRQLWSESLGKNPSSGSTPLSAVGATDQHSQVQLFMEGPDDKVVLFLRTAGFRNELVLPDSELRTGSTEYLMGRSMNELLAVESRATEKALTDAGRPSGVLTLDRIDEESLGALLYFLQLVTVYAGAAYDVNPFDQPGVEAGKRLTYGYFGRSGFAEEGKALHEYEKRARTVTRIE